MPETEMPPHWLSKVTSQQALAVLFGAAFVVALIGLLRAGDGRPAFATVMIAMAGAILIVAVLPHIEEFGIGPKGVNATIRRVNKQLDKQSDAIEVIDEQQRMINNLVIYSLADQPYDILRRIDRKEEYFYRSAIEDHQKWCDFLLNSGLIAPRRDKTTWLRFDDHFDGQNISEFAQTTPAGHFLVSLREKGS